MLPGLFKSKLPLTRFELTEAFKQPVNILNQLRAKETELKKDAAAKGLGSIDNRKYQIISALMQKIDEVIADFNTGSSLNEITDIIQATRKLLNIVTTIRRTEEVILKTPRNTQRENASNLVYYGAFTATYVVGSAISIGTVGKLATLFYVAPTVSKSIHEATGLKDLTPTSVRLLDELLMVLNHINANFTKLSCGDTVTKESEFEDFICPITQDIIKDPVVCTIDKHAYERSAIETWLEINQSSPLTREKIPPGKSVKDVLDVHYNYSSLLDKYRREHPSVDTKASI